MEVANTIFCGVNALAIIVLAIQTILLKQQITKTHEQARRDKTIEVLQAWCESLGNVSGFTEKVESLLTQEQCFALYERRPFTVKGEAKRLICEFCRAERLNTCDSCSDSELIVENMLLSKIRWSLVSYLNSTEIVALSWQQCIVDRNIIESEFDHLYNTQTGKKFLQNFRACTHQGNAFPAIEELCEEIKRKKIPKTGSKVLPL